MMTFQEKTSNFDDPLRDDRYYILFGGDIKYQTDDLDDACQTLRLALGILLKNRGLGTERGTPVSFEPLAEEAKTTVFHRDGVVVQLHELGKVPEMLAIGYGFTLSQWLDAMPESIRNSAAKDINEIYNSKGTVH